VKFEREAVMGSWKTVQAQEKRILLRDKHLRRNERRCWREQETVQLFLAEDDGDDFGDNQYKKNHLWLHLRRDVCYL